MQPKAAAPRFSLPDFDKEGIGSSSWLGNFCVWDCSASRAKRFETSRIRL
jgi:hypothetical protein